MMTGVLDRIVRLGSRRTEVPQEAPKCKQCGEAVSTGESVCSPCREDEAVRLALLASYQQTPAPMRRGGCGLEGKTILVVTGDRVLTRVLSTRLRDFGCRVICSWDASHALSTARRETPDVILMDQKVPGGDQVTIVERLRNLASLAFTPVVVLTDDTPELERLALLRGASACFPKRGRLEGLTSVLQQTLN